MTADSAPNIWKKAGKKPQESRAYFDERWIPEPNTGCWLWTNCTNQYGYGLGRLHGRQTVAHRIAWELYRGPIPFRMQIDHMCRVRSCVNPDHLRLVTLAQNVTENSLSGSAVNKAKTHCIHGHPFAGDNLWVEKNGARHCRICRRVSQRKLVPRNRGRKTA